MKTIIYYRKSTDTDDKQIKGIFCTSREYHGENSRDKFLLQLDLSLSKMDNEDRAKDTKIKW